jgi:hypothetical protein
MFVAFVTFPPPLQKTARDVAEVNTPQAWCHAFAV